jgi:hypothetical protein
MMRSTTENPASCETFALVQFLHVTKTSALEIYCELYAADYGQKYDV